MIALENSTRRHRRAARWGNRDATSAAGLSLFIAVGGCPPFRCFHHRAVKIAREADAWTYPIRINR